MTKQYGHFQQDGKEFVITNPNTPRPWINVISNGDYSMLISQTGGGYSFRGNAEQNRLTRSFMDIVKDNWGKYFYLRDKNLNKVWSAAWMPIKTDVDAYTVRHGFGYTVFTRESFGIRSELTCFVAPNGPFEYMSLKLTDLSGADRKLDVTGYFEWACGIAYDNHREFQRLFYDSRFTKEDNAIVVNKCLWGFPDSKGRWNNDDWPYTAFFTCDKKVQSFDCDKETFIGMYRDEKDALAMQNDKLACSQGRYCDPVGALRVEVDVPANQSQTVVFSIGFAKKDCEDWRALASQCNVDDCNANLVKVQQKWDALLETEKTQTPDKEFDVMTNYWCKYQALSCRMWAKAAYYQISGGIGFRDQLQDSLIGLESDPQITRKQILLHASKQFVRGDVLHWWLTYNNAGPRTKCSDDFLWLPFAVDAYIEETADYSVLDEKVRYIDGDEATIYDHCKSAINYSLANFSPRGIPLMGDHDWNDGLSAVGNEMKGESFWVAEFLYYILRRFDKYVVRADENDYAQTLCQRADKLKVDFNEHAWDGEWFLQATNDLGEKIGSKDCERGKIFLNPQIWAVIADITTEDRKQKAMQAVEKYLLKDYGALLLAPEYDKPNCNIGYITRYAPGLRENGGVYTHAATWAVWAFALMGQNELAYKAWTSLCPAKRTDSDVYKTEPYVLPGNSDGPTSPYFGKAGWSWYTGSAQWLHNVAVRRILGIIPTENGLKITPCIPSSWDGFTHVRSFRNAVYNITVRKTGAYSLTVDGQVVEGNVVPQFDGGEHQVEYTF